MKIPKDCRSSLFFFFFFLCFSLSFLVLSGEAAAAAAGSWKFEEDDGSHLVQVPELGSQAATEEEVENISHLEMWKKTPSAPSTLRTLSNASVIVRIENDEVMDMAMSGLRAHEWVARNVVPYTNTIRIATITVGNEIIEQHDDDNDGDDDDDDDGDDEAGVKEEKKKKKKLSMFLLPAMRNVLRALESWELGKEIKVSTHTSMSLLRGGSCSRPSSSSSSSLGGLSSFDPAHENFLVQELLEFLSESRSPFVINVDVFDIYQRASSSSSSSSSQPDSGLNDTAAAGSKLDYSQFFLEALLDRVISAMAEVVNRAHHHHHHEMMTTTMIPVIIALNSSSWPSGYEPIAATFNAGLVNHLLEGENHHHHHHRGGPPSKSDAAETRISYYIDDDGDDNDLGVVGVSGFPTRKDLLLSSSFSKNPRHGHPATTTRQGPLRRRLLQTEEWCVAKSGQAQSALQAALDWARGTLVGQGQVDCSTIQSTGLCYLPNDLQDHCSWAFNQYFQAHSGSSNACDFGGTATIATTNPSTSTCTYVGTTGSGNTTSGSNSTSGSVNSNSTGVRNFMQPQPSFGIAVVMAITYLLSGQAF